MRPFLGEDFLLQTETARRLYHDYAKDQPIFDFGGDVERGELPHDLELIGKTVADICYGNAVNYFGMGLDPEEGGR